MTDRDALYRAVCENPDEDTPRLIYADWLEEHGEVDRAAFIRDQIEAARAEPFSVSARDAEDRANALLIKHWDEWMVLPADSVLAFWFRRGFISEVVIEPGEFVSSAENLFNMHPIEALRLAQHSSPQHRPSLVSVFELPCLAQVRRLEFDRWTEFLDEDYVALPTCENLAGLRELAIPDSPIQPPWLSSLLEGAAFPALTGLELTENSHLGPSLTRSLPRADHRQLRRLDVAGVTFTSEQLQRVLTSRCLRQVEELRLGWTGRPGSPGPLFHLHLGWVIPWSRLRMLDLAGQRLGDEVVKQIASRPEVAPLRWLGLAHNDLTREAVHILIESRYLNLFHLDVRGNGLEASDIAALKERFPEAVVVG